LVRTFIFGEKKTLFLEKKFVFREIFIFGEKNYFWPKKYIFGETFNFWIQNLFYTKI